MFNVNQKDCEKQEIQKKGKRQRMKNNEKEGKVDKLNKKEKENN